MVGMVVYHFLFDLEFIFQLPLGVDRIPLLLLARGVASIFILIVGVSSAIKSERIKSSSIKIVATSFVKKAVSIFFCALIITGVTYVIFPKLTVVFGILHFIAVSLLLVIPFLYIRSNRILVVIASICLTLGLFFTNIKINHNWLMVVGITSNSYTSFDYFPVLPWFGFVLIGLVLGRKYWPNAKGSPRTIFEKQMVRLGQHSLLIYLWHQPVIWAVLLIVKNL